MQTPLPPRINALPCAPGWQPWQHFEGFRLYPEMLISKAPREREGLEAKRVMRSTLELVSPATGMP